MLIYNLIYLTACILLFLLNIINLYLKSNIKLNISRKSKMFYKGLSISIICFFILSIIILLLNRVDYYFARTSECTTPVFLLFLVIILLRMIDSIYSYVLYKKHSTQNNCIVITNNIALVLVYLILCFVLLKVFTFVPFVNQLMWKDVLLAKYLIHAYFLAIICTLPSIFIVLF